MLNNTIFTVEEIAIDLSSDLGSMTIVAQRGGLSLKFYITIAREVEELFVRAYDALYEAEGVWARKEREDICGHA